MSQPIQSPYDDNTTTPYDDENPNGGNPNNPTGSVPIQLPVQESNYQTILNGINNLHSSSTMHSESFDGDSSNAYSNTNFATNSRLKYSFTQNSTGTYLPVSKTNAEPGSFVGAMFESIAGIHVDHVIDEEGQNAEFLKAQKNVVFDRQRSSNVSVSDRGSDFSVATSAGRMLISEGKHKSNKYLSAEERRIYTKERTTMRQKFAATFFEHPGEVVLRCFIFSSDFDSRAGCGCIF